MRSRIEQLQRALESDCHNKALHKQLANEYQRVAWTYDGKTVLEWVEQLVSPDFEVAQQALDAVVDIGAGCLPSLIELCRESPTFAAAALASLMPYSERYIVDLLNRDDPVAQDIAVASLQSAQAYPSDAVPQLLQLMQQRRSVSPNKIAVLLKNKPEICQRYRAEILSFLFKADWELFCFTMTLLKVLKFNDFERLQLSLALAELSPPRRKFSVFWTLVDLCSEPQIIDHESMEIAESLRQNVQSFLKCAQDLGNRPQNGLTRAECQAALSDAIQDFGADYLQDSVDFCRALAATPESDNDE